MNIIQNINKNWSLYLIYIGMLLLIVFLCYFYFSFKTNGDDKPIKPDTTIINKIDTIVVTKAKPIYIHHTSTITDTLKLSGDTVKVAVDVPISSIMYKDSSYEAHISGYKAKLDSIKVYTKNRTVTVINYKQIIKYKRKAGIYLLPTVGAGYGIFHNQPDIYVGFSVGIKF